MATYNFTVRASDSAGAYADQNFSIDVLRTRIDRFVIACDTGVMRSVDGKTWVAEAAPPMNSLDYANRLWVGTLSNINTLAIVTSTDAVNWKTIPVNLPKPTGATVVQISSVKYRGGKWMAFGTCDGPAGRIVEWSSSDLVTWTLVGTTITSPAQQILISDFEYDSATSTTVLYVYSASGTTNGVWTRVGAGTFSQVIVAQTSSFGTVQFRNGLWMMHNTTASLFLSRDGVNWYSRIPGNNQLVTGVTFNNGQIVAHVYSSSSGIYSTFHSSNGGITWENRFNSGSGSYGRQTIAAYGGTLVMISSNTLNYFSEGGTVTNTNQTYFAGTPRFAATRQA